MVLQFLLFLPCCLFRCLLVSQFSNLSAAPRPQNRVKLQIGHTPRSVSLLSFITCLATLYELQCLDIVAGGTTPAPSAAVGVKGGLPRRTNRWVSFSLRRAKSTGELRLAAGCRHPLTWAIVASPRGEEEDGKSTQDQAAWSWPREPRRPVRRLVPGRRSLTPTHHPLLPSAIVGLCSLFSIIFRLGFDLPLTTIINFDFSLFSITHWSFGFVLYLIRAVSDVVACIMIFAY
jgi:hypothetical protein